MAEEPSFIKRLRDAICEAIAVCTSEDKMWTTGRRIQAYLDDYSDLDPREVEKHLPATLKELERQEVLTRKNSSFTFCSVEFPPAPSPKTPARRRKRQAAPKTLGPEVVLTSSGRISYRRSI
jgi:hypothetical protein